MQRLNLTRRSFLLLPLIIAQCGSEPERSFEPLSYNYLPPIQLNVAAISIERRFIPAGVSPDVSNQDPMPPIEALTSMANGRLRAFGTTNKAVFAILDASLTRDRDVVSGSMAVSLAILDDSGAQLGFAEARVQSRSTDRGSDLRPVLYDITKAMMDGINVEFEYQVRRNLKDYLTRAVAPDAPVEQSPLDQLSPKPPAGGEVEP